LKISQMTRRLLLNRLPTKDNLIRREINPQTLGQCASGCGPYETANHLFVGCAFYGSIWVHVRMSLEIQVSYRLPVIDHFWNFTCLADDYKKLCYAINVIWLSPVLCYLARQEQSYIPASRPIITTIGGKRQNAFFHMVTSKY